MITLYVEPNRTPLTWSKFQANGQPYSIALDGYVSDGPKFDPKSLHVNFNHHERVDRLATRATCAQVLMALRQGLFKTFRHDGTPTAHVFVNDCDEDVCTSWYLLKNHALCEQTVNPILNRLVAMEDALDATAGAYPFPADLPALRELAWVFAPYRQFRLNGGLDKRNSRSFAGVIEDVANRIAKHVTGNGDELALDTRYEKLNAGDGWVMVKEIGAQARTGMFADGITAFVSVRERPDGRWAYVVGRLSPFIPFNLNELYQTCNFSEVARNGGEDPPDRWGGSDTIGGSPRASGSRIPPDELARIIATVVFDSKNRR